MRKATPLVIAILATYGCSNVGLHKKSDLAFEALYSGRVIERKAITLEASESKAGRILVGLLSAGLVGAIATSDTEKGFSEPQANSYSIESSDHKVLKVVSRSVVSIGDCVDVISPDNSDFEILKVITTEDCSRANGVSSE